ncbi:protein IQ-DOMAIN 12-like [Typha angustifolia]|uniref:protein IQ-DOMAIN 12-like n=1 Tax=Typha angustifolia TaxID=59011 RepID=UPI003C2FD910
MAKKKSWFNRLKRFFISESGTAPEKERRKLWLLGRLKSRKSLTLPAPSSLLRQAEEEQGKHAVAVAVATAAAAEAAVAAAQAAAQVVRLTGAPSSYFRNFEVAAIKIQTAFRGYLARRALRALKGLVRLQALVRGQAVRRQTAITLKGLQSLMKIQSHARATRVKTADNLQDFYAQRKMREARGPKTYERNWDSSTLSKEEIKAMLKTREEASLKRVRALQYASSHQEGLNARRQFISKDLDDLNGRWTWLDQWVGSQQLDKDIPEIRSVKRTPDSKMHGSDSFRPLDSSNKHKEEVQFKYLARRSFDRSSQTSLRDDDSLTSSPYFPGYMASTASAKARFRSMSTPRERLGMSADIRSQQCSPCTNRPLSPIPSIASDACITKASKPPMLNQRSPRLKAQRGHVTSRRSSKNHSFDSECLLLNLDECSTLR